MDELKHWAAGRAGVRGDGCEHASFAQTVGTNKQAGQNGSFTLKVNSQLVVETVVVKDKQGHFVPGLTAKDFHVEEDGVPQTIRIFEHQELAPESTPLPVTPPDDEHITLYQRLVRTQIAPEVPGKRSTAAIACWRCIST